MGSYPKERAAERIAELSARSSDLVTFWRECTPVLEAAVLHYEPRFRDNETRVRADDPIRGEPFPDGPKDRS